ncbi:MULTISPECIES: SNF2-related protein [Kamptonema]|uniref:SNF2-related protein n=1 Tax=Kamptonema TaxID=1501433 RepID=UPI0001DACDE6|nr:MULTISPECIES: SNF2-related protein [Kamptonema]CBN56971.1 putative Helicase domain protein [Kamptonema sp. PCC 6506]
MNILNDESDRGWPERERFPYNYKGSSVGAIIDSDLRDSKDPLIITGYASLDRIIDCLDNYYLDLDSNLEAFNEIRILLGNEPYPTKAKEFQSKNKFSEEIKQYWQDRGISILKCGKLIAAIKLIKVGKVQTRIATNKPIHAKIFNGDNAITIGSSNYSNSGLIHQIEANVRFQKQKKEKEIKRFDEACELAEKIWDLGTDYNNELIELLEQLLSQVSWEEALARACGELLEGEWAKKYKSTNYFADEPQLWPSQEKGIAQAIWVIENVGSVLIADATGSGKTRMGAHLIKCVMNQIWKTGRMRQGSPVLICPPAVQESWEREFRHCDYSVQTHSHGLLSKQDNDIISAIRRGQVLAIDEGHNFFSRTANRTQALMNNIADYILVFTATPINRGTHDLLSIIELLGTDNFDDELLDELKPIWNKRGKLSERISPNIRDKLRGAIQQFTVRRTKSMLNRMIDEEPDCYKDQFGDLCRYPENKSQYYLCGETEEDRNLCKQIREESQRLQGLLYLKNIPELSDFHRKQGWTEEKYLEARLKGAKVLAAYQVMACLRSSRSALLEHIYGTEYAQKYYNIQGCIKAQETGNLVKKLEGLAGIPPQNQLQIQLPDWLTDPAKHKEACEEEIDIYKNITSLSKRISDSREKAKAEKLYNLLDKHKLIIAFDSRLITLYDIKRHLNNYHSCDVIIATGANPKEAQKMNKKFQPGSKASRTIALCSDAMSEGVNLQQASAIVQLTTPSVIRLAEQRIGRIDRMDNPHSTIESWWPKDSSEFALRSSEGKFLARHYLVSDLLGSNLKLPENLSQNIDTDSSEPIILEADLVKLDEELSISESWKLGDVFDPVRSLVEGEKSLVNCEVYKQLRTSKIRSSLSFVRAEKCPWAFFAIAGTKWGAPNWVYIDSLEIKPITDLEKISQKLRENLVYPVESIEREKDNVWLESFINILIKTEEMLLPKKKQRALILMKEILKEYKNKAIKENQVEYEALVDHLLSSIKGELGKERVDLSLLADWWLDIIRPLWFKRLKERGRSEPLRLKDLYNDLIEEPIPIEKLNEAFKVPLVQPLDERIVAAIIGLYV